MSGRQSVASLREQRPAVLPSLLRCDFGHLADEVRRLEAAGVGALHLDVMDGHFVPNLSYGLPVVEAIRRLTSLPLDVHLMIANPAEYLERYVAAGADLLTIHVEVLDDPRPCLRKIRQLGAAGGLAFNPRTPVERVIPFLQECDLLLVMSVTPGFGGQAFQPVALDNLRTLRGCVSSDTLLEVDGGINTGTIAACGAAGADLLVVGSAIFLTESYEASLRELTALAGSQRGGCQTTSCSK